MNQLRRKNEDVALRYFARGKLWDSPEQAQWAGRNVHATGEKRGRDWRPGGSHKDPRARPPKAATGAGAGRPDRQGARRDNHERRDTRPPDDRNQAGTPGGRRPWSDKPPRRDDARPWSDKPPRREDARPWSDKPPRRDDARPWSNKPARHEGARPWSDSLRVVKTRVRGATGRRVGIRIRGTGAMRLPDEKARSRGATGRAATANGRGPGSRRADRRGRGTPTVQAEIGHATIGHHRTVHEATARRATRPRDSEGSGPGGPNRRVAASGRGTTAPERPAPGRPASRQPVARRPPRESRDCDPRAQDTRPRSDWPRGAEAARERPPALDSAATRGRPPAVGGQSSRHRPPALAAEAARR